MITGVAGKSEFRMRADRTVVVYDDNPDNRGERPANALVKLLLAEGEVTDVFLLEGGFKVFFFFFSGMLRLLSGWLASAASPALPFSPYPISPFQPLYLSFLSYPPPRLILNGRTSATCIRSCA